MADENDNKGSHAPDLKGNAVPTIAQNIADYIETINSLKTSLSLSMRVLHGLQKDIYKKYERFIDENCTVKQEGEDEFVLVPIEHDTGYKLVKRRLHETRNAFSAVPRSFLVALVSEYDAFLSKLLVSLFRIQPDMLRASERTLTFSQLTEFSSIDDARDYVLEKEVENFLRQSHAEQFKWLEDKFKIPLRKDLPAWPAFIEVTERRNLFVHSGGVVSRQYIQNCKEHGVKHEVSVDPGVVLDVPWQYFVHAHATLLEIGVKLAQVLWRKLEPAQLDQADKSLSDLTFDLLAVKSYALAKVLLDFATLTLKKYGSEQNRLIFVINRAQAYKWSGDSEKAQKMLDEMDWSATKDAFQLANAVLSDNFGSAAEVMKKIGADGYPHKIHYREWPIFREFRKTEEFKTAFQQVFGETFFEAKGTKRLEPAPETATNSDETEGRT